MVIDGVFECFGSRLGKNQIFGADLSAVAVCFKPPFLKPWMELRRAPRPAPDTGGGGEAGGGDEIALGGGGGMLGGGGGTLCTAE